MNDLVKQLRLDAEAYRQSLASPDTDDMFSLAYQWQDKKHRHVYDLCRRLETAADYIEKLEAANLKQSCIMVDDQMRIEKLDAALDDAMQYISRADWHYLKDETRKALEGKE